MKIKPAKESGNVLVELSPSDSERLSQAGKTVNGSPSPFKLARILVPVDFSDCSKKALQYAVPFARQFGAAITLLHVVQVYYPSGSEFGMVDVPLLETDLRKGAETQLATLAEQEIRKQVPNQCEVRVGPAVPEIIAAARALESDLIILSTHGRTGLKHVFLGSVAENVVRLAPCPVLVVREHEHEFIGE